MASPAQTSPHDSLTATSGGAASIFKKAWSRSYVWVILIATVAGAVWAEKITSVPDYGNITHVVYWEKWQDFERDAMKKVVDLYNSTEGAKKHIFVDFMPIAGIEDKTIVAASGGTPPDIAGLEAADVAAFSDNGAIVKLDDFCKKYGIKGSDYLPVYWNMSVYKGHIFALPTTPVTTALHYNRAEFKAAGFDPDKPPQTFEEMDAMADKMTIKDDRGVYTQFGFIPSDPGWWNWAWGYFFGGKLWNGKDKITCNSPANIRAFEWLATFSKKYGPTQMNSFKGSFNFSSAQNPFIDGREAMQLQGVWMYNFITKYNPKLDWGAAVFPHPADRPDLANMTIADSDNLVIPVGAKHPKEAFDFMAFVQRQPNMEMLCLGQRKFSPLAKVSEGFIKNHPNPFIRFFIQEAHSKTAFSAPQMAIWNEFNKDMGTAFDEVTHLQKSPKEALEDVQERTQGELDHYLQVNKARGGE